MIDLIKFQIVTEKSLMLLENNTYVFKVDVRLNKCQIKKIFEYLFGIKIINIRTCRLAKKVSNISKNYNNFYKKVIIIVDKGNKIRFV